MNKQKGRLRFLSEHLDILPPLPPFPDEDPLPPESPKLKCLPLELDCDLEELHLSGDEDAVSRNTDFAIKFSTTTEANSVRQSNALLPLNSCSVLDTEGLLAFNRQRSKSLKGPESMSIFDFLKSRYPGAN